MPPKTKPAKLTPAQMAALFGASPVASPQAAPIAPKSQPRPKISAPTPPKAAPKITKPAAAKPAPKPTAPHAAPPKEPPKPEPQPQSHTKPEAFALPDGFTWAKRWAEIAEHSQKLLAEYSAKQPDLPNPALPHQMVSALGDFTSRLMADPVKLMAAQKTWWEGYMQLWQNSALRFLGSDRAAPPKPADKRFKDPAWSDNPAFDFIKQSYILTADWLNNQVSGLEGLDHKSRQKLEFYTRQFADALSPSNFVLTNPQVLRTTLETGGENLVKGLHHLLDDLEQGRIRMTDEKAFEVGKNIATTAGGVMFENKLMQLIQYAPTTTHVDKRPLLIVPPWINKYYILDLKPENSFIKWAVDQGLTVFCISWVNPDESMADYNFVDYMQQGILAALAAVQRVTQEQKVNIIGYCLGGTLLASTLAYLQQKHPQQAKNIASATYFTTLTDFKDAGDLTIFIDEEQIENIEASMKKKGFLDAKDMATTFNMLRANDLIWSFVVNNYLLGKEPFPFDLLYWNSDSTRMPAAMHSFYLREMYQKNNLIKAGGITLDGVKINLRDIKTPSFLLSAREDHIAPWMATYAATQLFSGKTTFVLAGSGHIAGVVNPPAAQKYSHWVNEKLPAKPQEWLSDAQENAGSWWPTWRHWLQQHSGGTTQARALGTIIEPAPGRYVKVRAV